MHKGAQTGRPMEILNTLGLSQSSQKGFREAKSFGPDSHKWLPDKNFSVCIQSTNTSVKWQLMHYWQQGKKGHEEKRRGNLYYNLLQFTPTNHWSPWLNFAFALLCLHLEFVTTFLSSFSDVLSNFTFICILSPLSSRILTATFCEAEKCKCVSKTFSSEFYFHTIILISFVLKSHLSNFKKT